MSIGLRKSVERKTNARPSSPKNPTAAKMCHQNNAYHGATEITATRVNINTKHPSYVKRKRSLSEKLHLQTNSCRVGPSAVTAEPTSLEKECWKVNFPTALRLYTRPRRSMAGNTYAFAAGKVDTGREGDSGRP